MTKKIFKEDISSSARGSKHHGNFFKDFSRQGDVLNRRLELFADIFGLNYDEIWKKFPNFQYQNIHELIHYILDRKFPSKIQKNVSPSDYSIDDVIREFIAIYFTFSEEKFFRLSYSVFKEYVESRIGKKIQRISSRSFLNLLNKFIYESKVKRHRDFLVNLKNEFENKNKISIFLNSAVNSDKLKKILNLVLSNCEILNDKILEKLEKIKELEKSLS